MQFITSAATLLLAASGALASPAMRRQASNPDVIVTLAGGSSAPVSVTFISAALEISQGVSGSFTTLELSVGPDAQQDLRCAAESAHGEFLFATRGVNLDDTFSDAGNGEWDFQGGEVDVAVIRCSPNFVANNRNAAATT